MSTAETPIVLGSGTYAEVHFYGHDETGRAVVERRIKPERQQTSEDYEQEVAWEADEIRTILWAAFTSTGDDRLERRIKVAINNDMFVDFAGATISKLPYWHFTDEVSQLLVENIIQEVDFLNRSTVVNLDFKPDNVCLANVVNVTQDDGDGRKSEEFCADVYRAVMARVRGRHEKLYSIKKEEQGASVVLGNGMEAEVEGWLKNAGFFARIGTKVATIVDVPGYSELPQPGAPKNVQMGTFCLLGSEAYQAMCVSAVLCRYAQHFGAACTMIWIGFRHIEHENLDTDLPTARAPLVAAYFDMFCKVREKRGRFMIPATTAAFAHCHNTVQRLLLLLLEKIKSAPFYLVDISEVLPVLLEYNLVVESEEVRYNEP